MRLAGRESESTQIARAGANDAPAICELGDDRGVRAEALVGRGERARNHLRRGRVLDVEEKAQLRSGADVVLLTRSAGNLPPRDVGSERHGCPRNPI